MKIKAILVIFSAVILSSSAVAHASNEHSNLGAGNSVKNQSEKHTDADDQNNITPTPQISSAPSTDTDCDDNTKNHGGYVSCVAHKHLGGSSVSAAAHSDIGKKGSEDNDEDDATPSVSPNPSETPAPTVEPSVSPTETPSITPSISPTETPSVTPTVTPEATALNTQIQGIIDQIKSLLDSLKSLIP